MATSAFPTGTICDTLPGRDLHPKPADAPCPPSSAVPIATIPCASPNISAARRFAARRLRRSSSPTRRPRARARGLAIATLALAGVGMLLTLVGNAIMLAEGGFGRPNPTSMALPIMRLAAFLTVCKQVAFLFFLRAVAQILQDDDLARSV